MKYVTTCGGMVVGGPFMTENEARSYGLTYARQHSLQNYQVGVATI